MVLALSFVLARANFGPINGKPLPPSTDKFDFIALGDNRPVGAGMPATPIFKSILQDVTNLGPAFVISSGDIVFGKDESIDLFKKECDEIQGLVNALPCPFYNAPGNHEINERQDFYDEYVKRFGATYGSFHFGQWKFVQISTEEVGSSPSVSQAEMGWLNDQLASAEPKMVFHHHPIYARETNKEDAATVGNGSTVAIYYRSGNVKYAFQGHDHVFNHQSHDGTEYYISGGAGAPLDAKPSDGGYFHFLVVRVDGTKVEVDPIPAGAIQITPLADGEIVGNYSDFPLHFHHLVIHTATKPTSVTAKSVKKKETPVDATIVAIKQVSDGFEVIVDVTAAPHLPTYVQFK